MPGSTAPGRVAITRPSSGVKPIVVAIERPPAIAASEQPLPRWQVTSFSDCDGLPEQLRGAPGAVGVAETVEPEAADAPALVPRRTAGRRGRPAAAAWRGRRCRRRRPAAHPGACALTVVDDAERRAVVQGRQRGQLLDLCPNVGVDHGRPR